MKKGLKIGANLANFIPMVGASISALFKIGGHWADRKKDALVQAKLSVLEADVSDLRNSLNDVKRNLENQTKSDSKEREADDILINFHKALFYAAIIALACFILLSGKKDNND